MDLKKSLAVLLVKIVSQETQISGTSKRVVSDQNLFFFSLLCDVVSDATDTIRFRVFFLNNQNPGTTVKSLGTGDRYQYYMNAWVVNLVQSFCFFFGGGEWWWGLILEERKVWREQGYLLGRIQTRLLRSLSIFTENVILCLLAQPDTTATMIHPV